MVQLEASDNKCVVTYRPLHQQYLFHPKKRHIMMYPSIMSDISDKLRHLEFPWLQYISGGRILDEIMRLYAFYTIFRPTEEGVIHHLCETNFEGQ